MHLQAAQMPGERGLNGTSAMIRTISQQKYNYFLFCKIYFFKKNILFLIHKHISMKTNYLLLLCLLIAACNNDNKPASEPADNEPQLQCNTLSDALLMGYKGNVKKVTERRFSVNDTNGALIIDKEAYITHLFEFDSTGKAIKHTCITNGGRDIESIETYDHSNGLMTAIHAQSAYRNPNMKDDVKKRSWLNESTYCDVNVALYRNPFNGKDTTVKGDSTVYTLDKQCRAIEKTIHEKNTSIQNTRTVTHKYSGDSIYTYNLKADGNKELRDVGFIQERDSIGNPTKVLYPNSQGESNVYTYTYEYY
jgi:hypothetical protein